VTNPVKTKFHRDGTITYWSVYKQSWQHRVSSIPNEELAAMNEKERSRVMKHLKMK